MRKTFLAVYDYGMGGLWAVISANDASDIITKYPMLQIVDARPDWMSEAEYERIASQNSFDLADDPPHWLGLAVKE